MAYNSRERLTLARRFLEPSNSTHRHYEALRAFFVEGLSSAQVAARFGYTSGSFRVLVHQFRRNPGRVFFGPSLHQARPAGKQQRLRERVVTLRKQNLSVHDISRSLARDDESLSPAAIAAILKEEGFAKLPRRPDDEPPTNLVPSSQTRLTSANLTLLPAAFAPSSVACSSSSLGLSPLTSKRFSRGRDFPARR